VQHPLVLSPARAGQRLQFFKPTKNNQQLQPLPHLARKMSPKGKGTKKWASALAQQRGSQ